MSKKIKYDELTYYFKSENSKPISFNVFNCPLGLVRKIKDGSLDLEEERENQKEFKSNLSETTRGKWECKSEKQGSTIDNIKTFYEAREKLINLFDDCITVVSKAN